MNLKKWWDSKTVAELKEIAVKADIHYFYLYQLCNKNKKGRPIRRASPEMAKVLEKATEGQVKRSDWRPDVWDNAA